MNSSKRKTTVIVMLAAALAVAASVSFAYHDYRREVANHRRVMVERGKLVLDSLAAGTRAHCRMGQMQAERLRVVFEELAGTSGVTGVALKTRDGQLIAGGGDLSHLPQVQPGGQCWDKCCFAMASAPGTVALGMGARPECPVGELVAESAGQPIPPGPYVLVAALDSTETLRQISREYTQFLVTSALLVVAILLGALVTASWLERRRLESDLAVVRERAVQSERLAQLGAGLAHETKNPLGLVRGLAQAITDAPDEARVKQLATSIVDETDRTVGQINSFLSMARPRKPEVCDVDLDSLLSELLPLVQPDAERAGAEIVHERSGLRVRADRDLLRRSLLNILLNAVRAVKTGGRIRLEASHNGAAASLSIKDDGVGIDAKDLPRVTEPYFSRFEGGCGLGLAITDQIARAHGWHLRIDSAPGHGTKVTIDGLCRVP